MLFNFRRLFPKPTAQNTLIQSPSPKRALIQHMLICVPQAYASWKTDNIQINWLS